MNYKPNDIIYLKVFKSNRFKITKNDCVGRYIYHVDYFKDDSIIPLYLKMLDFYGYVEIVNNVRILNIAKINLNDSVLNIKY